MNGTTLQIYICVQLKILLTSVKKNINLFKSLALHDEKVSTINNNNLNLKNLLSELGIFLIEK